jgi:hypothetical protein
MTTFNIGIAGGRDFSALYFVGLTEKDELLYFDPHYVHESIPSKFFCDNDCMATKALKEYHCKNNVKSLKLDKMCTSVAIGFYISGKDHFEEFKKIITKLSKEEDSIFSVYEKKP